MSESAASKTYVLAELEALPDIFSRVLAAKRLLTTGEAKTAAEAARLCGISRGSFYKYKDSVFEYRSKSDSPTAAVRCVLLDSEGILSGLVSLLSAAGVNILTISQDPPSGGVAPVSVTFRYPKDAFSLDRLLREIRGLRGVNSAELLETG